MNALAWEPLHLNPDCVRVASAAKDGTIKGESVLPFPARVLSRHMISSPLTADCAVWDSLRGHLLFSLSGHAASVTSLKWSGQGFLISGSQDRTIRVYNASEVTFPVALLRRHLPPRSRVCACVH